MQNKIEKLKTKQIIGYVNLALMIERIGETREKVNEIIEKVNEIIDIINSKKND